MPLGKNILKKGPQQNKNLDVSVLWQLGKKKCDKSTVAAGFAFCKSSVYNLGIFTLNLSKSILINLSNLT